MTTKSILLVLVALLAAPGVAETAGEAPAPAPARPLLRIRRPNPARYRPSPPIRIVGDGDHVIERRSFETSAGEPAIRIDDHASGRIVIRDCLFRGANGPAADGLDPGNGPGILAWQSSHIRIERNVFEHVQEYCVRIIGSRERRASDVRVTRNDLYSLQAAYTAGSAWGWSAAGIQFLHVEGPGNEISGNLCLNAPGTSYLTDFINVYCSSGTAESPLRVRRNGLVGGGEGGLYNRYGCGIQLNDHPADFDGGEHVRAVGNVLVDPGTAGMNINGGYRAGIVGNRILMANSLRTNLADGPVARTPTWAAVTLYNWSGGVSRDSGHEVRGNRTAFREPGGTPFVNQTNPPDTVIEANEWAADLTEPVVRRLLARIRAR